MQPFVQLDVSDEHADFIIAVTGTTTASLHSSVGPATVYLSTRGRFTSQLRMRFDGIAYHADRATSTSCNCSTVDRVCARRRGPVGRLVEHVGERIADGAISDINSVVEDVSEEILNETFEEAAVEIIAKLNQTTEFDELVDKFFPETAAWTYHLATRESFLLAGVGPAGAEFPAIVTEDDGQPHALLEMWLRTTPGQAAMLQMMANC
jgi:hypothetical protein